MQLLSLPITLRLNSGPLRLFSVARPFVMTVFEFQLKKRKKATQKHLLFFCVTWNTHTHTHTHTTTHTHSRTQRPPPSYSSSAVVPPVEWTGALLTPNTPPPPRCFVKKLHNAAEPCSPNLRVWVVHVSHREREREEEGKKHKEVVLFLSKVRLNNNMNATLLFE